jgi:hypothetical protein
MVNVPEDVDFSSYWVTGNDVGEGARKCFFKSNSFGKLINVQGNDRIHIKAAAELYVQSNPGLRLSVGGLNFLQLLSKFRFGGEEDIQWFELLNQHEEEFLFAKNYGFVNDKKRSFKEFSEGVFGSSKSKVMILF